MTHASCAELVRLGWFPSVPAARQYLKRHQSDLRLARIGRRLVVDYRSFVAYAERGQLRAQAVRRGLQLQAATLNVINQVQQRHASDCSEVGAARVVKSVDTGTSESGYEWVR